jgi:hypothetical protein
MLILNNIDGEIKFVVNGEIWYLYEDGCCFCLGTLLLMSP